MGCAFRRRRFSAVKALAYGLWKQENVSSRSPSLPSTNPNSRGVAKFSAQIKRSAERNLAENRSRDGSGWMTVQ